MWMFPKDRLWKHASRKFSRKKTNKTKSDLKVHVPRKKVNSQEFTISWLGWPLDSSKRFSKYTYQPTEIALTIKMFPGNVLPHGLIPGEKEPRNGKIGKRWIPFRSENREYLDSSGKRLFHLTSNRDFLDFWLNGNHPEASIHWLVANTGWPVISVLLLQDYRSSFIEDHQDHQDTEGHQDLEVSMDHKDRRDYRDQQDRRDLQEIQVCFISSVVSYVNIKMWWKIIPRNPGL